MGMAAPNLAALYDFEGQFETAVQAILEANGILAFLERTQEKIPLINTGIAFTVGPAIDELTPLPIASGQTEPEQEYFRYNATLQLDVEVPRDNPNSPKLPGVDSVLAESRALIRSILMRSQWAFRDSNLPYYRVSDIRPGGTFITFDQARNTDTSSLQFAVTFAIQPTAWPTGFPPS